MRLRVAILCIAAFACRPRPFTQGAEYKPRSEAPPTATQSTPTPVYTPPPNIRNTTPPNVPPPEEQPQPPVPEVTPPTNPEEEETGGGTQAPPPSPERTYGGGIGSNCGDGASCGRDSTVCLTTGYPGGLCSKPCSRFCPDDPGVVSTLCVNDQSGTGGLCVAKCTQNSDCRAGYKCETRARFNEPEKTAKVCVPETEIERSCDETLADILPFAQCWLQPEESWAACGGVEYSCAVRSPTMVPYRLNGVQYEHATAPTTYLDMSCRMAQTLFRLGYVAKQLGVHTVRYQRLYQCEGDEDFATTSEHGIGEAIDIVSIGMNNASYDAHSAEMKAFMEKASYYHIFNNIYTSACNTTFFGDHVHADLGLGAAPIRDFFAGHWQIDEPASPSCSYDWSNAHCSAR